MKQLGLLNVFYHVSRAASVKSARGLLAPCTICLHANPSRLYSDGIVFLDETQSTGLKRGAGGRSSFSGVVATVFGASGFLGNRVCNRLGKCGTQLIIPYRGEHADIMHLKLAGDLGQMLFTPYHICDEDSIRKAVKHSNVVINLVGRDWNTRNFTIYEANVESAERIARISKEMGVKKFIHMSALNSNMDHEGFLKPGGSEFLKAKGLGEELVRDIYPDAVIFRPSDMYGFGDRFIRYYMSAIRFPLKNLHSLPYRGEDIWKQPVYAGDVASGIVKAVYNSDSFGQIYEAVGPRRYELCELIHWLNRIRGFAQSETGIAFAKFYIMDLKYDPITRMKAALFQKSTSDPYGLMTTDRFEREAISDVTFDYPNLKDLGVELTLLENRVAWEMKNYQTDLHQSARPGEIPVAEPAPYYNAE